MGLKVVKPMILETDNHGFCDLANNRAVVDRTRYEAVHWNFLRELKKQGFLRVIWIPGEKMTSNTFTKNLPGPLFRKHSENDVSGCISEKNALKGRVLWVEKRNQKFDIVRMYGKCTN
eukprot:1895371-Ditylum_brightwellii.AAC.1